MEDSMSKITRSSGATKSQGASDPGGGPESSGGEDPTSISAADYDKLSDEEKKNYIPDPNNPGHYILDPNLV
jgi:hypothetical protein